MAILSTGPIENRPVGGVRPTQQVTVKFVNRDSANSSTVLVQGYFLNGTRTLYVLEVVSLTPNEVATRNYFANFDAFQFVFTTSGPAEESTEISVWGKNASGQLVTAHRLVSDELLGSEVAGPQGPQGETGPQGPQGPPGTPGPSPDNTCFQNLRTKLLNCTGQIISLSIRGCCDPLQGRLTEVEEGVLILDRSRVFSICDITSFSPVFIAYVTNAGGDNNVSVISTATNTEIAARIPVGTNSRGIAITPDGSRAYVTSVGNDTVSVISTSTNTEILPRILLGNGPAGIAITPDGSRAYVTNQFDNNVSVINTATNTEILPRITVGANPRGIAITPDGSRAYVTNLDDGNVSVINIATNTEILPRIIVGTNPRGIAITPDGSRAYVTNQFDNNVSVINTSTNTEIPPRISVGAFPVAIAITPNCV